MPWQLIYTSAPRGLLSGQSGFCTVARSANVREALVQRLEQISSYHYLRVSEAATANRNPTISAFRLLDLRGAKYYVLTRIQPCGLDFTARTNHVAHHLVFQPDELVKLPSPAAILRSWPGWMASWQGEPRLMDDVDPATFGAAANFLPARTWAQLTGDGGRAAGLLESECVRGCYLVCPSGSEEQVLQMYCETLQLLNFNGQFPLRPWRHTFTAFLQAEDNPNDFQWRGCQENTPAYKQALNRSAPMIALRSVRVPGNSLVKLAREETAPPPPPAQGPPPSDAAPKSALSLRRDSTSRAISVAPSVPPGAQWKKPGGKRPMLDFNFSLNWATLASVGIFVAVLVGLVLLRHQAAQRPPEQGNAAPAAIARPSPVIMTATKPAEPVAKPTEAEQLASLAGDGPTYILAVPNLTNFYLPMDSIIRLQRLLRRYDRLETLPSEIRLEVATDRWNSPPGAVIKVDGRTDGHFSASGPGLECDLNYSGCLSDNPAPLPMQVRFDNVPKSFSMQFGFPSPTNGDPFRLLIVNENHSPAPLAVSGKFVRNNCQELAASLAAPMRDCLLNNFTLLGGRRWQLRPFLQGRIGPARYLYKDWPTNEAPLFDCQLDFARIATRLTAERDDLKKYVDNLARPLGRPLGQWIGATNGDNLQTFPAYSPHELTPSRFLAYLSELKNKAPEKNWIKRWNDQFESDQIDDVAEKMAKLYDLWTQNRSQDQSMLTMSDANGTTNYFFAAWELLKERAQAQSHLADVRRRLDELDQVAFVSLCIVDPMQPKPPLEMIRFQGP